MRNTETGAVFRFAEGKGEGVGGSERVGIAFGPAKQLRKESSPSSSPHLYFVLRWK